MIKYFALLIIIFASSCAPPPPRVIPPEEKIERIGIPGPLHFNETEFSLVWTARPKENYFVQEYLPAGESLEKFKQMLTVNLFITNVSAHQAAVNKAFEQEQRKEYDPIAQNALSNGRSDDKEILLDFILSTDYGELIEFNAYRYIEIQLTPEVSGLLVIAYSKRAYLGNHMNFLKELAETRANHLGELFDWPIPEIALH